MGQSHSRIVAANCFEERGNARLEAHLMKTLVSFVTRCSGILLFTTLTLGQNPAQSPQTAPVPGSSYPPGDPRNRVMATGMAANGGSIANGVYSNSIYGFSLQIPPGWAVLPTQSAKIAGSESDSERPEVQSQIKQVILIMSENAPMKRSVDRNQVQIIVMHLPNMPGPTAAEGYIAYSQRMAKEKGIPVEYKGSPESTKIHNQSFSKISLEENTEGSMQHIEQYVTTQGQALLQFLLISPNEDGLKTLEPVIQSVQFKAMPAKKPTKKKSTKSQTAQH